MPEFDSWPPKVQRRARRYLVATLEVLDTREPMTNKVLAKAMGMTGKQPDKALSMWRGAHPEVEAWVSRELTGVVERAKGRLLAKFERLGHLGSVDHAIFVAKVLGWFNHGVGGEGDGSGTTVAANGVTVTIFR